jgi:hypothetical protein
MSVAVYKLRIRDEAGDEARWQERRIVAPSLAEALVQAQQRFGEDRVMAIAQDTVGEAPTEADLAQAALAAPPTDVVVPEPLPDPRIVPADAEPEARVDAMLAAAGEITYETVREPMPWEGRWRPANLLKIGVAAGLLAFAGWYAFGAPASQRFVTAAPAATGRANGLELGEVAPRGGVLAATGVPLHRGDDPVVIGQAVGEAVADIVDDREDDDAYAISDEDDDVVDDPAVRTIGAMVGDMFARGRDEDAPPRDDYPLRDARTGEIVGAPAPSLPPPPPREPSVLQPYFVGVDRGGGVIETLRVPAYDADHARAIVSDLPERPVIVRGPTLQLDW